MPTDLIYDITVENDALECGKYIRAPEHVFRDVAGILLKIATEKPDISSIKDLRGPLFVDHETQANFFSFALQMFGDILCGISEDDVPVYHRQKPDNPCVWQELQEGVWVDVFDTSLCLVQALSNAQEDNKRVLDAEKAVSVAGEIMEDFTSKYTGTSASYDAGLVITGPDEDRNRAALCTTLRSIVEKYAKEGANAKQQQIDGNNRASMLIGAGIAVVTLVAAIAAIPSLGASAVWATAAISAMGGLGSVALGSAVSGVTAAGLSLWAETIRSTELVVLTDEAAINAVSCAWYNALEGQEDISQAEYAQELTIPALAPRAPALYAAIKPLIEQELSYVQFLRAWGSEIAINQGLGEWDACACELDVDLTEVTGNLTYVGKESGFDVYELTAVYTGHYAVANATSVSGFYVRDIEVIGAAFTGPATTNFGVPGSIPDNVYGASFSLFQVPPGDGVRLFLSTVPGLGDNH